MASRRKAIRHLTFNMLEIAQAYPDPSDISKPLFPLLASAKIYKSRIDPDPDQVNRGSSTTVRSTNQQNLISVNVTTGGVSTSRDQEAHPVVQGEGTWRLEIILRARKDYDHRLDDVLDDLEDEVHAALALSSDWQSQVLKRHAAYGAEYGLAEDDSKYGEAVLTWTLKEATCIHLPCQPDAKVLEGWNLYFGGLIALSPDHPDFDPDQPHRNWQARGTEDSVLPTTGDGGNGATANEAYFAMPLTEDFPQ